MDVEPLTHQTFRNAIDHTSRHPTENSIDWQAWLVSPVGLSSIGSITAMILLGLVIRPPMVQRAAQNEVEKSQVSVAKVAIWGIITFIAILSAPYILRRLSNRS